LLYYHNCGFFSDFGDPAICSGCSTDDGCVAKIETGGGRVKNWNMMRKGQIEKVEKGAAKERVKFMHQLFEVAA
jgi:hypothetical protein